MDLHAQWICLDLTNPVLVTALSALEETYELH